MMLLTLSSVLLILMSILCVLLMSYNLLMVLLNLELMNLGLILMNMALVSMESKAGLTSILIILTMAACEASLGLSCMVKMSRSYGNDLLNNNHMIKC